MKKLNFKKISLAVFFTAMSFALVSCGGSENVTPGGAAENTENETPDVTVSVTEEVTEETTVTEPEIDPAMFISNPLTGEYGYNEAAVGKRPVAIMINNIDLSLPQYGIGSADYMYEVVVEGGITRMMAVYADYTNVPNVCSIRSCRYYFPIIAYGLDAIYCHWGADQTIATETLERLDIDRFDGYDGTYYEYLFYNDEDRLQNYDREHTGFLMGSMLPDAIESAGYRTDSLKGSSDMFNFASGDELTDISETTCTKADVIFSESYFSTFTYDSETGKYLKQHSGSPHMDLSTGEQLAYTNVFALNTQVSMRGVGELMDVELISGTGYYLSGGKVQNILWEKPSESENFVFTDMDGNALVVNRGKCYFGITDNIEIY